MLSFHLKGLDRWQQQEYLRTGQEIRAKGLGMTWADEQQAIAYERAALNCMINQTLDGFLERLSAEAKTKTEGWTRNRIKIVELAARKGVPVARDLIETLRKPTAGRTARGRTVHPSCPREEL
jgi:hypothetical protein